MGRSRNRRYVRGSLDSDFLAARVFYRSGGGISALAFNGIGQMVDGDAQFRSVNGYFQFDHGVLPPKNLFDVDIVALVVIENGENFVINDGGEDQGGPADQEP